MNPDQPEKLLYCGCGQPGFKKGGIITCAACADKDPIVEELHVQAFTERQRHEATYDEARHQELLEYWRGYSSKRRREKRLAAA